MPPRQYSQMGTGRGGCARHKPTCRATNRQKSPSFSRPEPDSGMLSYVDWNVAILTELSLLFTTPIICSPLFPPHSFFNAREMDLRKHILDWDESDVHQWLSNLGFGHYERQIRGMLIPLCVVDDPHFQKEHKIQGDSLCLVDTDGLKNIGISSMGQRLSILKGIYEVKIAHNVEFGEDDYIPPCTCILVRHQ